MKVIFPCNIFVYLFNTFNSFVGKREEARENFIAEKPIFSYCTGGEETKKEKEKKD
jgi:hypothetical protein